jgi:hypothetical protein
MTFGQSLRAVVQVYGGSRAAAARLGVRRWTLYRWFKLESANRLQVGTLARITSVFPELKTLLETKETI